MQILQNPFNFSAVAGRYDAGRPYFHPIVVERIKTKLALTSKVERALDVGCGTGMSSKALLVIAQQVEAIDASAAMLDNAFRDNRINYICVNGEDISYPEFHFDLVTISQALHWLDQEKFFRAVARVLKSGGKVVVYDNFFLWNAAEKDPFALWYNNCFLLHFPLLGRGKVELDTEGKLRPAKFKFFGCEHYQESVFFSKAQLIKYFITLSFVVGGCEMTGRPITEVITWLEAELGQFYCLQDEISFNFGGPVYFLERELSK